MKPSEYQQGQLLATKYLLVLGLSAEPIFDPVWNLNRSGRSDIFVVDVLILNSNPEQQNFKVIINAPIGRRMRLPLYLLNVVK